MRLSQRVLQARWVALAWLGLGCQGSPAEQSVTATFQRPAVLEDAPASPPQAPLRMPPPATLLGQWCERAGEGEVERLRAIGALAAAHLAEQERACAALTAGWSPEQRTRWLNYLVLYTQVMAGCEPLAEPPPGGIRVFGLANTAAVGAPPPALHEADVRLLIELYVMAFSQALLLTPDEAALLEAHLWSSAAALAEARDAAAELCAPLEAGDG